MKKIITGALTLLLFIGTAQAQTKDSTKRGHHKKEMVARLNLTAEQQARLKSIRESQKQEFKALQAQGLKGEDLKTKRKELHKKYAEQSKAVFTPSQKEEMRKMKTGAKLKSKEGRKHGKAGKHGRKHSNKKDFAASMNFSDAQKQSLESIRKESKSQIEALRNDASLSETQKKEKIKALRKSQHEKMKAILTPEQAEKMKAQKKSRKDRKPKTK